MRKAFELNINMIEGILDVCNNKYDDVEYVDVDSYSYKEKIIIRLSKIKYTLIIIITN